MSQPQNRPNHSRGLRWLIPSYRSPAAPPPSPSAPPTSGVVAQADSRTHDPHGDPPPSRVVPPARVRSTHSHTGSQSTRRQSRSHQTPTHGPADDPPPGLSDASSPAVPDSVWFASNFLVGAGMVILQPSTAKIVLLHDVRGNYWFLPKGRKDVGESLEQAALREAYEESGYRAEFLPLFTPHRAPVPPESSLSRHALNTEPIFLSTTLWKQAEYLTFWYVGQITENAVHTESTMMSDEVGYTSHLLTIEEATRKLEGRGSPLHLHVLLIAYNLWRHTEEELSHQGRAG